MANSAPSATGAQYRFRTGMVVSPWMTADQLKEAALRGDLSVDSEIQQVGHTEWVIATNVKGLVFPQQQAADPHIHLAQEGGAAAVAQAAGGTGSQGGSHGQGHVAGHTGGHAVHTKSPMHPRFATVRDLLAAYLNADIEINLPETTDYSTAHVCMVGTDHFEVSLDGSRGRVFVPYSRIRLIWVTETSNSSTLSYREAHRVSVELEQKR